MMRVLLLTIFFVLVGLNSNAQIRSWKITDHEKYIQTTDSPLVVNFWATYCVPCKEEIPYFEKISGKFAKNKVKLLLVSLDVKKDYPEKIMEYLRKEKIRAEVVWLDETDADYFIPRIDSSWTGALPATLLSSKGIAKPLFFDRQLKPEELEKAIQKILHPDESNHKK